MAQKSKQWAAIIMMIALFAMIAFVTNLCSPMATIVKNQFGASELAGQIGNYANFIAYLVMGIPSGMLIAKLGYKKTALLALIVGIVGIVFEYLSGVVGSYVIYLVGAFISGLCMCMLNTVVNPLLNVLGGGGKTGNQLIQIGGAANSAAAVAVYILMGALIGEVTKSTGISDATPALIIAGVIFVIAFVILLFTKIEEPEQAKVELSLITGALNAKIVGQKAATIAEMAGVAVPPETKILIGEVESVDISEEFAHEKLSPVLAMYKAKTFDEAIAKAEQLVADGGYGHTSALYIDTREKEKMEKHAAAMKTCRILINTPSSQGGIGDLYNFKLVPSLTLGCGSWGGNSVSENVGVKHLINIKTVAERRENMLWIRTPEKVYFKKGCLPVALDELGTVMHKKRCFIVTDSFLYKNGYTKKIEDKLDQMGIVHTCFYDVEPDPSLASARAGAAAMRMFEPDCIIAMGGGSAMDAGKIMWVLYENPDANFDDMAMDFMDIRKRIFTFPHMGKKAYFIAVPTSSGTGSEVTPFAIITDKTTGIKWPLADYELMPDMAIVDTDNMMSAPKGLTCASGIDVMTHALEAYASMMASDYTDGLALNAIKLVFNYLPRAYKDGSDVEARQHMANASCMAGMAFANAFLGVNHSLAHKLGAFHHLPHGIANALVLLHVLRYNAAEVPAKMGTFPQYQYPHTLARYAEIGRSVGLTGKNDSEVFEKLLQKLQELMDTIEIKHTIREYGVDEKYFLETLDEMTEQAFNDQCTGANPRYPLMSELKEIYLKAYYGEGNIPESGKAKEKKEEK